MLRRLSRGNLDNVALRGRRKCAPFVKRITLYKSTLVTFWHILYEIKQKSMSKGRPADHGMYSGGPVGGYDMCQCSTSMHFLYVPPRSHTQISSSLTVETTAALIFPGYRRRRIYAPASESADALCLKHCFVLHIKTKAVLVLQIIQSQFPKMFHKTHACKLTGDSLDKQDCPVFTQK